MKRFGIYLILVPFIYSTCLTAKIAHNSRVIEFQATRSKSSCDAFKQRIAQGNVIVDFYGDGCPPCRRMAPIFSELSGQYTHITFIKVNVNDHPEIADTYRIRSIPQLFFFKDGVRVDTVIGETSKADIMKMLDKHFK